MAKAMSERRARRSVVFTAMLGAVVALSLVATAGHDISLTGSQFEIDTDANLTVEHLTFDWVNAPNLEVKEDLASGSGDDSFGQGSKEDTAVPSPVTGSIPPNKSDLKAFGISSESNASGDFIHLFWSRVQDPSGTTNMDFEFNQSSVISPNGVTPVRTVGDLLIVYELSQGGTNPVLAKLEWLGAAADGACEASNKYPCWGNRVELSGSGDATGSINSSAITAGNSIAALGALDPRTFGEASIDLSAILGDTGECATFGSVYLKSRSSDSFTSALKDYVAPLTTNISNCGAIDVKKVTVPTGSSKSFGFTSDIDRGGDAEIFPDDPSFNLSHGGTKAIGNVLAGSASVSETVPTGWKLTNVTCTVPDGNGGTTTADGFNLSGSTASFNVKVDEKVTCTFFNQEQAKIVVKKETNPDGAAQSFDFLTSYDGDGTETSDFSLTDGQMNDSGFLTPGQAYTVAETVPTGWELSSVNCSGASTTPTDITNGKSVTPAAGEVVTCTFNNTEQGKIIVKKETDPDGSAQSFDFLTSYDGDGTETSDFGLTDGQMNDSGPLSPGTYTVAESVPTGWDLTSISCLGAATTPTDITDGKSVTLGAGETVTCTFNNRARGQIDVVKTDDAGNLLEGVKFSLHNEVLNEVDDPSFGGEDTDTGTDCTTDANGECSFTNLVPGSYWVVEDAGFVPSGHSAADPALAVVGAGGTVDLDLVNPRLHKVVVLVCHLGTDTLAPSDYDLGDSLGADAKTSIGQSELDAMAITLGVTSADLEDALCGIDGFGDLEHGEQEIVVDIASDAHPAA